MIEPTAVPVDGRPEHRRRPSGPVFLPRIELGALIDLLREDGRRLIGPTIDSGTIVYDEISSVTDLPIGWGDEQAAGSYKVVKRNDERCFGYVVGPTSWKRHTFPASVPISVARRAPDGSLRFEAVTPDPPKLAFLGVRGCELAALGIQDKVFTGGPYVDVDYRDRRAAAIVVAVQCTTAASTCFCTSMGTGPEIKGGHDIVLTELDEGFVLEAGSLVGDDLLERLPVEPIHIEQAVAAAQAVAATRTRIGDPVSTAGLHDRLLAKLDSPRWAEVAERCLSCANCTLVCPTCFCTSVERATDLAGTESTSHRVWDSCFTGRFAAVAGGNFRPKVKDRYRQWLTHKFATWWDQFGSFGCVGCGRCVTWCPVAIDVREELAIIAPATPPPPPPPAVEPIPEARQEYVPARVVAVRPETADTWTLQLSGLDAVHASGLPGQFVMVSMPEHPPAAISVSRYDPPDGMRLTIRAAGPATAAITALQPGAEVGIRGPVGNGWPVEEAFGHDVVIVTGGTGLAPLRPLIDALLANRDRIGEFHLYYGARTAADMLFTEELEAWAARPDLDVTCRWLRRNGHADPSAGSGPARSTVSAIHQADWDGSNAVAFVCGPERMMEATSIALAGRGITGERVWVTLERHMECGVGLCGHCQMGRYFICRDGPVFRLPTLATEFGREGL
ncbi:MAG TPA: 4Fe-4S dicluster domain-containing protein [Clostridia bacterium]|nr:4Fe-4S dicluster domain-containing protein [Clostridia bacterium]